MLHNSYYHYSVILYSIRMADEEDSNLCKVEYLDDSLEVIEETNWIKHQGRCRVTYPNGDIFEGNYNSIYRII